MHKVVLSLVGFASLLAFDRCQDTGLDGPCGSGGVCGFDDHRYDSVFYCPPQPLQPGGWIGYSWRDAANCRQECLTAANWGCDVNGCEAGCGNDLGTGQWLACTEANGGTASSNGCFLSGSGVRGETVDCNCR